MESTKLSEGTQTSRKDYAQEDTTKLPSTSWNKPFLDKKIQAGPNLLTVKFLDLIARIKLQKPESPKDRYRRTPRTHIYNLPRETASGSRIPRRNTPIASPIQETSSQAGFHTATPVQEPIQEHSSEQDPDQEPFNDPEPSTDIMSTNPGNTGSKGPAMAKPTPFDRNRK